MKAMILAAGLGTRLRPLTNVVSKPMVQMAGRPCMEHAVRLLARYGITDIVVNLHYMPEIIEDHFGNGEAFGVNITYSYEKELLGTAGGFKRVQSFFGSDRALIISGDALTDIDLHDFRQFHTQHHSLATLALKRVADPSQYGVVICEGERIFRFQEKPTREEAISNLANTGIYLFDPAIFEYIPAATFYDFGKQVFPELLAKGEKLCGYTMSEYWCDVGDLAVYRESHYDMLTGVVQVDLPGRRFEGNIWLGQNSFISPNTRIIGPVLIGNHTTIEEGASILGPAIIGNHTHISRNAIVKRSILWDHVLISEGTELSDSIVASGCRIAPNLLLKSEVIDQSSVEGAGVEESPPILEKCINY